MIYRVYESYHSDSESGTYEYGFYSTLELAQARMRAVWDLKKYGEIDTDYSNEMCIIGAGVDGVSIGIRKIEIDKDTDEDCNGYT